MTITDLKLVKTIRQKINLNYVVRSIIYSEDPNILFLTLRGGGISIYDVSDSANPILLIHWDEKPCRKVEGQDRKNNLFVVTDISRGGLFLFDVSNPSNIIRLSYLKLDGMDSVLHARIYETNNKMYALLSGGFNFKTDKPSDLFAAVDITSPKNPVFVSKINTGILGTEGISIKDNYAFLGGFMSSKYSVIDLSDITNMKIVKTLDKPYDCEMVSEIDDEGILYAALWGDKGGLATFDISNPKKIHELSHVVSKDMAKANRVNIQGNYVFIPLEFEEGGGVGIVDKTNPKKLVYVKSVLNIPGVSKPYCLAVKDDYLYLFSSKTNSMSIMKIIKK